MIKANHKHAYRSNEWAEIMGVVMVNVTIPIVNIIAGPAVCYHVKFEHDGAEDYWPVYDEVAGYEFDGESITI